MNNIDNKLKEMILEHSESSLTGDDISLDMDLQALEINSISFIKIIVNIENEFEIEFDDEDLILDNFKNLQSLIDYIDTKKNNK